MDSDPAIALTAARARLIVKSPSNDEPNGGEFIRLREATTE
jgi:hypothetical protein